MRMEKIQIKVPFKAMCLNSRNKPDGIPNSKWIEEGKTYTVIKVSKMMIQGGVLGFKLAELNIDDCFPYQYFSASRFGIPANQLWDVEAELDQLLKEAQEEYAEIYEEVKAD